MKLTLRRKSILLGGIFAMGAAALVAARTSTTLAERWYRDKFDSREVCDARNSLATSLFDAWWYRHDTQLEQWYREKFRLMSPLEQIHLAVKSR